MTEKRFGIMESQMVKDTWFIEKNNYIIAVAYDYNNAKKIVKQLNKLVGENEQLKQQLSDCKEKKQQMKEFFMNSEPVIEQKELQKLIYQIVINLIDEKIKEADEGFEQTYDSWYQGQIDALKELKKELQ